jgi:Plasmid replication region DNA-binding N-term
MSDAPIDPQAYGIARKRVTAMDVERTADALLRAGERPTIERIRARLGGGSPNTVNPLLDAWWRRLGARLEGGPAALERLPEAVAHVAEALWLQALQEGRRRAQLELKSREGSTARQEDDLQVRSHVLSLREGELTQRLDDRDRRIALLELELREVKVKLRQDQATVEALRAQAETAIRSSVKRFVKKRAAAKRSKTRPNKKKTASATRVRTTAGVRTAKRVRAAKRGGRAVHRPVKRR